MLWLKPCGASVIDSLMVAALEAQAGRTAGYPGDTAIMTRTEVARWRRAMILVTAMAIVALILAAAAGGALGLLIVGGWAVAAVVITVVGWRLRFRANELVAVSRAFIDGDYERRARMPEGALATLGSSLNALGERLQATAAALGRSTALLDGALGALAEGVACIDQLDRIIYANRAYMTLVGSDEVLGQPFYLDLGDPTLAQAVAAVRAGKASEPVHLVRGRLSLQAKAVAGNGEVVVIALYDRTGIERLEMRRRDFMSAVSHELKTPLTSILGFAETALCDDNIDLTTTRNFFQRIVHHAERLDALVRDIITLSRLEEGEWAGHPEVFDLRTLIEELLDDVRDAAARTGVRLELLGVSTLMVELDPELLRMLLSNLISNAVRYNRPNGTVWVRLFDDGGGRLRMEIEDTGIGIPPEHQERVFERFYRVDSHRSRQAGGTGLGLSIVKHLLQQLGGRIELQSGPEGTCFMVRLPVAQAGTGASGQSGPRR